MSRTASKSVIEMFVAFAAFNNGTIRSIRSGKAKAKISWNCYYPSAGKDCREWFSRNGHLGYCCVLDSRPCTPSEKIETMVDLDVMQVSIRRRRSTRKLGPSIFAYGEPY